VAIDPNAPWVFRNHFCYCLREMAREQCWRAICRNCGNYIVYHYRSEDTAAAIAVAVLADHDCHRWRESDPLRVASMTDARSRSRQRRW